MPTLPDKPTDLATSLGVSIPYASQLLNGKRPWPRALALTAHRKLGVRVGPLVDATDDEIAVLDKFEPTPTASQVAA